VFRGYLAATVFCSVCLLSPRAHGQTIVDTPAGPVSVTNVRSPFGFGYYGGAMVLGSNGRWALVDYPIVVLVDSGGPADRAGMKLHDTLLSVNGNDARTGNAAFRLKHGETRFVLRIRRGEEEKELVMEKPGSPPPPPAPPR
jgi:S1-C subfamily serine protease